MPGLPANPAFSAVATSKEARGESSPSGMPGSGLYTWEAPGEAHTPTSSCSSLTQRLGSPCCLGTLLSLSPTPVPTPHLVPGHFQPSASILSISHPVSYQALVSPSRLSLHLL